MPTVWGPHAGKTAAKTQSRENWKAGAPGAGRPNVAVPLPGRFHMWEAKTGDPAAPEVVCLLSVEAPRLIRGMGGWAQIERGGRRAGSYWPGGETPAFEIGLVLENRAVFTGSDGVRAKMRALERLCGGPFAGDEAPPAVQWAANTPLHDYPRAPTLKWVCESFDYGAIESDDKTNPLIVPVTIVLAVQEGDQLERLKKATPFPRKELRKGETLRRFAQRVLGDKRRWTDIASLNRDDPKCPKTPDAPARKAVRLAVPPREPKRRK